MKKLGPKPLSILVTVLAIAWLIATQLQVGDDAKTVAERARDAIAGVQAKAAEAQRVADQLRAQIEALQGRVQAGVATPAEVSQLRTLIEQEKGKVGPAGPAGATGPTGATGAAGQPGMTPSTTTTTAASGGTTTTTRPRPTTTTTRPRPSTTTTTRPCVNAVVVKLCP